MLAVFDSSALVKLVVLEQGSTQAALLWNEAVTVAASRLVGVEVPAALSAAHHHGRLDEPGLARAAARWQHVLAGLRMLEVTPALVAEAAALTSQHVLGGADALHLAGALSLADADPVVVVWDRRLHTAVLSAGLRAAPAAL